MKNNLNNIKSENINKIDWKLLQNEMKNKFGFVLIRPQLGQNIGSCARALKNFGFKKCEPFSHYKIDPNSCYMTLEISSS